MAAREEAGPPSPPTVIPSANPLASLTLQAGEAGILRLGFQQVWESCVPVPKATALVKEIRKDLRGWKPVGFCCYWKVKCSVSTQPQTVRGVGTQDAYPPQPDKDPVGLCPGSLLIGCQEVLHHGDPPAR